MDQPQLAYESDRQEFSSDPWLRIVALLLASFMLIEALYFLFGKKRNIQGHTGTATLIVLFPLWPTDGYGNVQVVRLGKPIDIDSKVRVTLQQRTSIDVTQKVHYIPDLGRNLTELPWVWFDGMPQFKNEKENRFC